VVSDIDYNAVPDTLTVVPSLLEANDIIEMEEIERDLGFKSFIFIKKVMDFSSKTNKFC
jgi:hypothetical protein